MVNFLSYIILILALLLLSGCQLDAENARPALLADAATATPLLLPEPTAMTMPTETSTPAHTPTVTPTATPSPSLVPTVIPSNTPISSSRLKTAQQAFASGDYETARAEFDFILTDPGAELAEQELALYWRGRSELALGNGDAALSTLNEFLRQYPSSSLARVAQFNLARAYEQLGQVDNAVEAYRGSIKPDDPANVYIYEIIGDHLLNSGAYTQTIAAYLAGIDATSDVSFKVHLREGIAQVELRNNNNPAAAIAQYEEILKIAQIDSYRAKILRLLGEAHEANNDPASAQKYYLEAINSYPTAYDSYLALVELVNANVPVDEFVRGQIDFEAEAYQPAIAAFQRYLDQVEVASSQPLSPTVALTASQSVTGTVALTTTDVTSPTLPLLQLDKVDEALWLMGRSWHALGQYNSAIATYQRIIDSRPNSPYWAEAHMEMGQALIDQGSYSRAITVLRDFASQNPGQRFAPEALWRAARLEMGEEKFDEAHTQLHRLIDSYPGSSYAGDALYWAGQSAYQLQDYQGAINDWQQLASQYPASGLVNYGNYWRARALFELNRPEEARDILQVLSTEPPDYYVLRARDLITGPTSATTSLVLPDAAELAQEKAEAEAWLKSWFNAAESDMALYVSEPIRNDPAFQRGQILLELGLRDKALVEFEIVKDNWWDNALAMYQLSNYFADNYLGRLSILTAARLIFLSPARIPEEAPLYIQRLYYPVFFADVIEREAREQEVEPALVAALIRQESLFEQSAESVVGARGLMQVMPATGEYVAERSDYGSFHTDLLWLPYINIKFGAWYISQQLGIFNDNYFAAMAAYNAGPGNVLEWQKISDDLDVFVESIPFFESRTYIRRVYVNLDTYRRIYGGL